MNNYRGLIDYLNPIVLSLKEDKYLPYHRKGGNFIQMVFGYKERDEFLEITGFDMDTAFSIFTDGLYEIPEEYDENFCYWLLIPFEMVEKKISDIEVRLSLYQKLSIDLEIDNMSDEDNIQPIGKI
jgi:hypothetical protein